MAFSPEDLPPLWRKPAFGELIDCLRRLRVEPPVWNLEVSRSEILKNLNTAIQERREVSSFLSGIIKSSLDWIHEEDQREELWTEASRRLSERCGRTAMGEVIRRWPFQKGHYPSFELTLKEPPLTGDSLGLKTWGSSYVFAQMLERFAATSLSHLLSSPRERETLRVLELGSGTGLLGLAAAAIWGADVVLTDLPLIMANLDSNVDRNRGTVESLGGSVDTGALTWGGDGHETDELFRTLNQFKIVLAADTLYDDDHPDLLASAVHDQLSLDGGSRALVMAALRDEVSAKLIATFKTAMGRQSCPLGCTEEGKVDGQDDWGDGDEGHQIQCWWGIFRRRL